MEYQDLPFITYLRSGLVTDHQDGELGRRFQQIAAYILLSSNNNPQEPGEHNGRTAAVRTTRCSSRAAAWRSLVKDHYFVDYFGHLSQPLMTF